MKPNFALYLSFESIRLLHRVTGGWRLVGEVSPEAGDLEAALAMLRKTATALAPDGLRCKLVIPNGQIRYLTLLTPGLGLADRRDAARDALAGATPYAVEDLAFDIAQNGDETQVAAVAFETLQEAEAFARDHRFHPVSFVALPDATSYHGEPYFGPTRAARALLAPGETVEPDGLAISVVGETETPDGPVADVAFRTHRPSGTPPAPERSAATFRSARHAQAETDRRLADALASLQPSAPETVGVTRPDVPPIDVVPETSAFSSRRASADRPDYLSDSRAPVAGFAEPEEPFAPKPRSVRAPVPAARQPKTTAKSEAARLTVFGARGAEDGAARKRSLPLGLTAVLVLILAGLGAASFGTLQDKVAGWVGRDAPASADITAVEVSPPIQQPVLIDPAETGFAALEPDLSDEDAAVLDALRTPLNEDDTAAPSPRDMRASYAVTGIWPQAPAVPSPPPLVDIEDLYVTSIDPIEPAFDAVALPDVVSFARDVVIEAPGSPAAAGTTFALDSRGLVVPTAQGVLNPDGVAIFAGAPPLRPTAFPSRDIPAPIAADPVQTALAAFRPRARPADLVETTERATLDGLTRSELAELRPPARPAATTAAAAASLVPLGTQAPPLSDQQGSDRVDTSNSQLALAASLRPGARPSNFGQIVARAQRTAASAAAVGAASIAPRAVAPSIPSTASVAREATVRNAINLRRVNLIGVYGTPSNRRALVRLSNGRYKKVQVGDRIDGGRISAIGEGELRYQKSGRNLVLKMPSG